MQAQAGCGLARLMLEGFGVNGALKRAAAVDQGDLGLWLVVQDLPRDSLQRHNARATSH